MRPRNGTRPALILAIALALSAAAPAVATADPTPTLEKVVTPISTADAPLAARSAGEATLSAADYSVPEADWTAFRDLNLLRLAHGSDPVIRHGAIDTVARNWANYQAENDLLSTDDDVEAKLPAGIHDGVQILYWWAGDDLATFLGMLTADLHADGATEPGFTDSGLAVVKSPYGFWAYYIVAEYTHSTPAPGELPLYRFYKPSAGTHFYSTSAAERNNVISFADYRYEGLVAYINSPHATSPTTPLRDLNRFYLPSAGTHFYTSSPEEYAAVVTYPQYSLDGVAGRVFAASGSGLSAMHRFFRPESGTHFYSANPDEVATVKGLPGYTYEGIGFYLRVAG